MIATRASWPRRNAARVVALAVVLLLGALARADLAAPGGAAHLAARFQFARSRIPSPGDIAGLASGAMPPMVMRDGQARAVNPNLRRIDAWVEAMGAAVAVADVSNAGVAADVCEVDPRFGSVALVPLHNEPFRYAPVVLDPAPLPYDVNAMTPTGCVPGDYDEDGNTDLLVSYWGRTPILFAASVEPATGERTFRPREVVPVPKRWYTTAVARADLDGDGHPDLVVANYFADGTRVLDPVAGTPVPLPDSPSDARNGGGVQFLRWSGGAFENVPTPPALASGWTTAIAAADLDGDLLPELYVVRDFGPDTLLRNESRPGRIAFAVARGARDAATPRSKTLGRDSFHGHGVDVGDLNGDGRLDLFVSNVTAPRGLQESNFAFLDTGGSFTDRSERLGLARGGYGWDVKLGDFANDGRVEVVQANGMLRGSVDRWPELQELMFANDTLLRDVKHWPALHPGVEVSGHEPPAFWAPGPSGRYVDVGPEAGLGWDWPSRGVAPADVDGDGRLDLVVAYQEADAQLYRNQSPGTGGFLDLALRLPLVPAGRTEVLDAGPRAFGRPSPAAVGARVEVRLAGGRRYVGQVDGGNGSAGRRSEWVHVGLGQDTTAPVRVTVRWRDRSGTVHVETLDVRPGRHVLLLADA